MSDKDDFNLMHEMSRGCLYRGGESERNFLNGYFWTGVVLWTIIIVGSGIEIFIKWLF